jgi:CHASE2 domain-containing sensor protein
LLQLSKDYFPNPSSLSSLYLNVQILVSYLGFASSDPSSPQLLEGQVSERELDAEKMREDLVLVGSLRKDRNLPIFSTPQQELASPRTGSQSSPMVGVTNANGVDGNDSAVVSARSFPVSLALRLLCQAAYASEHGSRFVEEARLLSVDIMCELFVARAADLKHAIRSVAYIPNVPELKQVC